MSACGCVGVGGVGSRGVGSGGWAEVGWMLTREQEAVWVCGGVGAGVQQLIVRTREQEAEERKEEESVKRRVRSKENLVWKS